MGAIPFATVEGSYVVAQFSLASHRSGYCHGSQSQPHGPGKKSTQWTSVPSVR